MLKPGKYEPVQQITHFFPHKGRNVHAIVLESDAGLLRPVFYATFAMPDRQGCSKLLFCSSEIWGLSWDIHPKIHPKSHMTRLLAK